MRKHFVMDPSGHETIEFDQLDKTELEAAMGRFEALTKSGHTATTRKAGERDYKVVKSFKDTENETLFVPAMKGG